MPFLGHLQSRGGRLHALHAPFDFKDVPSRGGHEIGRRGGQNIYARGMLWDCMDWFGVGSIDSRY